jgi:single-strand DNA-binding protein
MLSLNEVKLIGNLGSDPEIRATKNGKEIANLSVATSERWKDKASGERKERTEWHRVSVFAPGLVKAIKEHYRKGQRVYVEGKLQTRTWEKDGQTHYSTEIVVETFAGAIRLVDAKPEAEVLSDVAPEAAAA